MFPLLASTTPSSTRFTFYRSFFPLVDVHSSFSLSLSLSLFLYRRQRAFNLLAPFVVIVLLGLVRGAARRGAAQGRGKSVHSSVTALGCAVGRVTRARTSRFKRLAVRRRRCHWRPLLWLCARNFNYCYSGPTSPVYDNKEHRRCFARAGVQVAAGGCIRCRVLAYANNRRGSVCARKSFAPTKDSQIAIFRAFLRFSFRAPSFPLLLTFRIMFVFVAVCPLESLHGKAYTRFRVRFRVTSGFELVINRVISRLRICTAWRGIICREE